MTKVSHDISDALDSSLEMPSQYGSRGYWRYQQVTGLIGMVAIPILLGLSFIDTNTPLGGIAYICGLLLIGAATVFFVVRDRKVQARIDRTGSPLAEREIY